MLSAGMAGGDQAVQRGNASVAGTPIARCPFSCAGRAFVVSLPKTPAGRPGPSPIKLCPTKLAAPMADVALPPGRPRVAPFTSSASRLRNEAESTPPSYRAGARVLVADDSPKAPTAYLSGNDV